MNAYFKEGDTFQWVRDRDRSGDRMTVSLRILRETGRSGNKQTLIARDIRSSRQYFLKVLFCEKSDGVYVEKESKVQLYSPFIVRIYGGMFDEDKGRFITLVEYIPGRDLSDLVTGGHVAGSTWDEKMKVCHTIVLKFLYGIRHYMTRYQDDPIVHRDLKPENVMAAADGSLVKIIDFDWVHLHESSATIVMKREQKGTPGYADPKFWNSYVCRKEMDIYSAGLVLYFIYTGHHHFHGNEDINRYMIEDEYAYCLKEMPGVDDRIAEIIAKMIAPEEERYSDINEIIADLEDHLIGTGKMPEIPELLSGRQDGSLIRFTYRVGDVKYSPYIKNYGFVPIEFGTRQERARNGALSGKIMAFYRQDDKMKAVLLHEDCHPILIQDPEEVKPGDLYTYAGTGIEVLRIRSAGSHT